VAEFATEPATVVPGADLCGTHIPFLENLRASGKVSIGRLRIPSMVADRVSAALDLERGKLKISELRADLLGGKHRGDWQADLRQPLHATPGAEL
jgi:hypothetical protein